MSNSPDQPRTVSVACLYAILAKLNEPNLGDRHFFEWLDNASIDYLKGANAELAALRARLEEAEAREWTFVADAKIVCDAFDDLLFVRNTDGDHKSDWALKFAEPIRALLELRQLSTPSKEQDHE